MIKKYICAVLVAIMSFSMITIDSVLAATKAEAGEELQTLIDLGFVKKDVKPNEYVSRGEFIDVAVKLRNATGNIDVENTYTDLNKDDLYYNSIMLATTYGIVQGGGVGTTINANNIITATQMQTILLRTLGYVGMDNEALNNAARMVNKPYIQSGAYEITWDMAAKAIFDAMDSEAVVINSVGNGIGYEKTGKLLLEYYCDIYKRDGIVQSVGEASINGVIMGGDGTITVDGVMYACNLKDATEHIGRRVKMYYTSDDMNVICMRDYKNDVIVLKAANIDKYSNNRLDYHEGAKNKTLKTSINADVLYNNRADLNFEDSDVLIENGTVTLIDNNDDGVYDVINIEEYQIAVVSTVDNEHEIIYTKYPDNTGNVKISIDDFTSQAKKDVDIRELMQNDVMCLYKSKDGMYLKAVLCVNSLDGTISSIFDDEDGCKTALIDGKEYVISKSCLNNQSTYIKIGTSAEYTLDVNDQIAFINDMTGNMVYGYLMNIFYNENTDTITAKLMNVNNEFITANLSDKLIFNGSKITNFSEFWENIGGNSFRHRLIRFKMNSNNEITEIQSADAVTADDALQMYYTDYKYDTGVPVEKSDNRKHYFKSDSKIIGNRVGTDSNTIVMIVPDLSELTDEKYYKADNYTYFVNDLEYKIEAYNTSRENYIAEVVVIYDDVSSDYSVSNANTGISVLDSKFITINQDGDSVDGLIVWTDGAKYKYPLKDNTILKSVYGSYTPSKGDIVRYETKNGEINKLELIYSAEADTMVAPTSITHKNDSNHYTQIRIWDTYIFYRWGSYMLLSDTQPTNYQTYNYSDYDVHSCATSSVIVCNLTENNIYLGNMDSIIGYKNTFGTECSRAIIYERYGEGKMVVIYK